MFQDFRYSDTTHLSRSVEVLKLKKFQERCNIKAFQEWYEHVGPEVASPQGGKVSRWQRDCAWLMISRCSRSLCQIQVQGTSSIKKVNDHYNIFTRESQEYELKTKDKAYVIRPNHPRLDIVRPKASNSPIKRSYFTQPFYRPKDLKPDVTTFGVKNMTTVRTRAVVSKGKVENVLKKAKWVWRPKMNYQDHGNPEILLQDHAVVDSGCSSHMTGIKAYLSDFEDLNGGFVAFGSDPKGGKITGKGKIKTTNLDFDDVYFIDELKFNLFFVLQMCDKKNSVLFTESECLILSPSFKLLDESQVVLRAPRKDGVYSLDLKNIVPSGGDIVPLLPAMLAGTTMDQGNTSGSAEDSMQLKELIVLVPTLVTRINSLEKELKDTKQTLGNVVLKSVKKVKSLEKALKRKSKKVLISESEGEEPEDRGRKIQDIDDDCNTPKNHTTQRNTTWGATS
ncbi:hypothetical protein Tco_1145983 [Tanacetum coccineum]